MHRLRSHPLIAFFAVVALFVASTAYVAHVHAVADELGHSHCDLCLQLTGTSGAPAQPPLNFRPVRRVEYILPANPADSFLPHDPPRSHRSRAPPSPVI
jgi:hypothetical protein